MHESEFVAPASFLRLPDRRAPHAGTVESDQRRILARSSSAPRQSDPTRAEEVNAPSLSLRIRVSDGTPVTRETVLLASLYS